MRELLLNIINEKYEELKSQQEGGIFEKILFFEANAIGQIGESFVKEIFKKLNLKIEVGEKNIHDEFDLMCKSKKIEIKTARKGLKNNSFQFNGINPKYNYDFIILLGLTTQHIFYYIIDKNKDYKYDHKSRKELIKINYKDKLLVAMNPGNQVNFKLTLNINELKNIDFLEEELLTLFS